MIIYTTNLLTLPFIVLVWCIDLYLLLTALQLLLAYYPSAEKSTFCMELQKLTDLLPQAIDRWISAHKKNPLPAWLPRLLVILTAISIRQLILFVLFNSIFTHP